ncbi:LysM domain receptor-like kinase 3 [Platanthera zijinensis]|uniref:LysM domain receptor-like kinase 3 n=1 Tax=Platanthera zijinensis TaxID=2320716 RepID=A0AAP0BNP5_9ASPA
MCRRRGDALVASHPRPLSSAGASNRTASSPATVLLSATTSSSSGSLSSLSTLRASLPDPPTLFPLPEISAAVSSPLSNRLSSSSTSWRCSLRSRDAVIFQHPFLGDPDDLPARLATVCKSHHKSLVRLLGASLSSNHVYLVYDFAPGTSLSACLRNPRNPEFTPLSSWISRMQIAADFAQGLDYIHHHAARGGSVHNRIKSSAVIVSETSFSAKICHFGAAFLAGEIRPDSSSKMRRSDSRSVRIDGTIGYLAPEVIAGNCVTRKSDVFAFGVVLLELISGEEPLKYKLGAGRERGYECVSLIETAREAVGSVGWEDDVTEERIVKVRRWVDRRLKDSFPVEVAEKMTVLALRCVEGEAAKRPGMSWVEGKISQLFLESKAWSERFRAPADISASFAPR